MVYIFTWEPAPNAYCLPAYGWVGLFLMVLTLGQGPLNNYAPEVSPAWWVLAPITTFPWHQNTLTSPWNSFPFSSGMHTTPGSESPEPPEVLYQSEPESMVLA